MHTWLYRTNSAIAIQTLLPCTPAVHHLGLFREPTTLEPVEYYNNLPFQPSATGQNSAAAKLAIIIDPVVATGSTASAAIQTLKEWGVERILFLCVLGSYAGLVKAAGEWKEGVQVWTGAVDAQVDVKGMIQPGLGDIGDRLFSAGGRTWWCVVAWLVLFWAAFLASGGFHFSYTRFPFGAIYPRL